METLLLDDDLKKEFETDWDLDLFNDLDDRGEECFPKPEHLIILSKCFGHTKFRPLQWKIIHSIITERRDNCAIMATGYGKSLCYQFPAVYMAGLSLVVSPLISLMEDQVLAMKVSNISACLLGSANNKGTQTMDEILQNKYSLVYLTPEFCTGDCGKELLQKMYTKLNISLIAVDEAHCVSSWGHDFRLQYRHLGILKEIMPDVPILAVTATATQKVRNDIIKTLKLRNTQITSSGFDRPNLYLSVQLKGSDILSDLRKVMKREDGQWKFQGATIIYCITRKQTEEISLLLNETGVISLPYHAGLSLNIRKETHEKFVRDKVGVIVATIAFGMGIDKPDIRNIVHYGASSSIEAYYQEVGRAGRDGLPAVCSAFYCSRDFDTLRYLNERTTGNSGGQAKKDEMLDNMRDYLSTMKCRRQFILSYFEDKKVISNTHCCDNCSEYPSEGPRFEGLDENGRYDFTKDAEVILKAIDALDGKYGLYTFIQFLKGSKQKKLARLSSHLLHGSGRYKPELWWKGLATLLEKEKYLQRIQNYKPNTNFQYPTICVTERAKLFLKLSNRKLLLEPIPELFQYLQKKSNAWLSSSKQSQPSTSTVARKDEEKEPVMKLYQLLMNKRHELATLQDCMPYTIASNKALIEMAEKKPITLEQLRKCQLEGFTEAKITKFGEEFLKIVRLTLNKTNDECVEKMSIQDALHQHPLIEMKQNVSAHTTYSLFQYGLTMSEISQKRGTSLNTIMSHLIDVMKLGYPIKLAELEITNEIKNTIEEAIKKVDTGLSLLTPIKNVCPPHITYNQIKAVITYLQIRQHLKNLNVHFIEFDDIDSVLDIPTSSSSKCEPSSSCADMDIKNSSEATCTQNLSSSKCEPSTSCADIDIKNSSEATCTQNLSSSKCEPSTSCADMDIKYSSEATCTQNLKQLINAFELENNANGQLKGEGEESYFSDGSGDAILTAACDKLEANLNEQQDNNVRIENSCEQSVKTITKESSGFDFSILDSPPRKVQEKRKLEEKQKKHSRNNENTKKMKLPPWLMVQRIA